MILAKIWKAKTNGAKMITVPRKSELEDGDYVILTKVVLNAQEIENATRVLRGVFKQGCKNPHKILIQ